MRTWLRSLEVHLDTAMKDGKIDVKSGEVKPGQKLTDEAKIARRLLCSYGNIYNCTGRVSFSCHQFCHVHLKEGSTREVRWEWGVGNC